MTSRRGSETRRLVKAARIAGVSPAELLLRRELQDSAPEPPAKGGESADPTSVDSPGGSGADIDGCRELTCPQHGARNRARRED